MKVIKKLYKNEWYWEVKDEDLKKCLFYLKNHMEYNMDMLVDIIYTKEESGYERLRYELLSSTKSIRMSVNCKIRRQIESVNSLYKSSNWLEREIYDLFGVYFIGNTSLTGMYKDYGEKVGYRNRESDLINIKLIEEDKLVELSKD